MVEDLQASKYTIMTEVSATPQTQTAARPGGAAPSLGARPILSVRQIEKVYGNRDSVTRAINDISFDVAPASSWASWGRRAPARRRC